MRHTPARRDTRDVAIPLTLIVLGFLLYAVVGFRLLGARGPALVLS
jgi:hypothetical protein